MIRRLGIAIGLALALAPAAHATDFTVDARSDGVDAAPGDGHCATASGACTLRAAVQEANATAGADTVVLPAGRYRLSRPNVFGLPQQTADLELDTANGDLDILDALTVRGAGADKTIVDAGHLDRAFSVGVGMTAFFSDLEITNGDTIVNDKTDGDISLGGAILNNGGITLDRVALVGNRADGGGVLFTIPETTFTMRDSLVADNVAVEGGGLRLDSGGTIINTTITGNRLMKRGVADALPDEITGYGGGIDHRGGADLTIVNSTITNNHAYKAGGGLNSGRTTRRSCRPRRGRSACSCATRSWRATPRTPDRATATWRTWSSSRAATTSPTTTRASSPATATCRRRTRCSRRCPATAGRR